MDEHGHHENLIGRVASQFEDIFNSSSQGMYIYLDDTHKVCNKKFSGMLGYESPDAWAANEESFTESFVSEESAGELVGAYANAMQKMEGSHIKVTWKKKNGENINTEVILVPIAIDGHVLALHFVKPLK